VINAEWVADYMSGDETLALDASLYQGLAGFRFALRRFLAFSEAVTSAAGVTSQQYQALLVIKSSSDGAVMVKDLADQMLLQHHGAVQLVDRLVKADLVERRHSPADGRSVLVAMTAKGELLLEHLASAHIKELLKQEPLLAESLRQLRSMAR
jgi:DNA-binding MarR family transcriptional regulator